MHLNKHFFVFNKKLGNYPSRTMKKSKVVNTQLQIICHKVQNP